MTWDLSNCELEPKKADEEIPNFCPRCRVEYREGFTVCADCGIPLVHELTAGEQPAGRADETEGAPEVSDGSGDWVTVLEGVNAEDLMVARSVLDSTGIPSLVQGGEPQEPVEPGRLWTASSAPVGAGRLQVRKEDLEDAREVLNVKEEEPGSEGRVEELEHKLAGELAWFVSFCAAGLALAFILVPGDWDQQIRMLSYIFTAFFSGLFGSHIRKARVPRSDCDSAPNS
jgi:hypothetical protein